MKSIAWINTEFPNDENHISYEAEDSLRDYDIIVFDPELPYCSRIEFTGGGSCISIESTNEINKASLHWGRELTGALAAGKTVFVVLNAYEEDQAATGSTMHSSKSRNYSTTIINNYRLIPGNLRVRNARGRHVVVKDPMFKSLYDATKEILEYRVIFESSTTMRTVFTAKDGTAVGGVMSFKELSGSLVLLPYFGFQRDDFIENSDEGQRVWSKKALSSFHSLVSQLVAIDRSLRSSSDLTPPPDWLNGITSPKAVKQIEGKTVEIDAQINELHRKREEQELKRADILEYSHLLYETGKPLERAIEKVLRLLGYTVQTLSIGDLEIDHVIIGPSGRRMIGESEGKDSSAIDISKFRQLESNIGEDFERDEVEQPAKGILFGNGYRLSTPAVRAEQFTQKSLTNAKRLGSALIRTADLYKIAVYLLDNPEDDAFRANCRTAIEDKVGGIVSFPEP
ncbi:MAG: hypothetical protein ACRCWF_10025 [Beijerinckiaceae bacterium]